MLQSYTLTPGALDFLEAAQANGVPVFSLTNDTAHWAVRRRQLLGIDAYFSGTVVSGAIGIAKPQPGLYQELLKLLPCAAAECVFVDDREANVDAAAKEGLATVLFGADGSGAHTAIADFHALAEYAGLGG
jgi:HAD superfamily hydrolase (TIGR01509 family)